MTCFSQVESRKLDFKDKAAPKVGSLDQASHKPGGGAKKVNKQVKCFCFLILLFTQSTSMHNYVTYVYVHA